MCKKSCSSSGVLTHPNGPGCSMTPSPKTSPLPSPSVMDPPSAEDTAHAETLALVSPLPNKQEEEGCVGNVADQRDAPEKNQPLEDFDRGIRAVGDQGEEAQAIGRYEYMDIRRCDSTEGEDKVWEESGGQTSDAGMEERNQIEEVFKNEHKDEEEEMYHNTNKQPLRGDLSGAVLPRPDVLTAGVENVEEYEEMTRLGLVPSGWKQADYQNLPVKGRTVTEEMSSSRCAGIGGYIKVCAGIGEPGSNTSFDNPDYWHSRLFIKPDAVRT